MRFVPLSLALFALAACAPGDGGDGDKGASPLPGMELAVPQTERDSEAVEAAIIDLTAAQLREKIASGDVRLIDVRRDDETAQGVIPGAEHIALDNFDPATLDLSDGREVVIYCRSGRRSRIAAEQLAAYTGEQVRHLEGGILAWQEAGGPIAHD